MKLYRYDAGMTDDIWTCEMDISVGLTEFNVTRETECCFVIKRIGKDKFILKTQSGKRFAYASREAALNSFGIRSIRRIGILEDQLRQAKDARKVYEDNKEGLLGIESHPPY